MRSLLTRICVFIGSHVLLVVVAIQTYSLN